MNTPLLVFLIYVVSVLFIVGVITVYTRGTIWEEDFSAHWMAAILWPFLIIIVLGAATAEVISAIIKRIKL